MKKAISFILSIVLVLSVSNWAFANAPLSISVDGQGPNDTFYGDDNNYNTYMSETEEEYPDSEYSNEELMTKEELYGQFKDVWFARHAIYWIDPDGKSPGYSYAKKGDYSIKDIGTFKGVKSITFKRLKETIGKSEKDFLQNMKQYSLYNSKMCNDTKRKVKIFYAKTRLENQNFYPVVVLFLDNKVVGFEFINSIGEMSDYGTFEMSPISEESLQKGKVANLMMLEKESSLELIDRNEKICSDMEGTTAMYEYWNGSGLYQYEFLCEYSSEDLLGYYVTVMSYYHGNSLNELYANIINTR